MPVYGSEASGRSNASGAGQTDNTQTIADLQKFVTEFREHDAFIYRDRLRANCLRKEWTLEVEMGHLIGWREDLASRCRNEPGEMLPLVRNSCWTDPQSTRSLWPNHSSRSPCATSRAICSSPPLRARTSAPSAKRPSPRSSSSSGAVVA